MDVGALKWVNRLECNFASVPFLMHGPILCVCYIFCSVMLPVNLENLYLVDKSKIFDLSFVRSTMGKSFFQSKVLWNLILLKNLTVLNFSSTWRAKMFIHTSCVSFQ